MRFIYYFAIAAFIGLIGFNGYKLDFSHWDQKDNWIKSISILAGTCGLILCLILLLLEKRKSPAISEEEEKVV